MKLEKLDSCPSCGSKNIKKFMDLEDYSISHESFTIDQCLDCELKFTNPRPTENEIGKYYQSEEYVSHSDTKKGLINFLYHKVRSLTLKQKVKLINAHSKKSKILDVGCGTGYFLQACKNNGWKIEGTEPDTTARLLAEKNINQSIHPSIFSVENINSFGVVSMWHVLEHVHQLNETITKINVLLKSEGKLIIAVPNPDSKDAEIYGKYWAAYDVPRHLYHFNYKAIEVLLNKHNFKIIETKPMIFDSYYVSMMSEKYKNKKINMLTAIKNGMRSNLGAKFGNKNYSSIIYIAEKLKN